MPFGSASMEQLAMSSGIPRSTLYYRFANKDTILRALLDAMIDDLEASTSAALVREGPASMRLGAVVRAQLQHLLPTRRPAVSSSATLPTPLAWRTSSSGSTPPSSSPSAACSKKVARTTPCPYRILPSPVRPSTGQSR
ncbi:MAG: TetR/AcrR family transcriptional regulator [Actinomycetota bacterium]